MIVLIGFIFGGGSPCMIIVSFIGLATRFLYYRYIFIRFCRVPKTYNQALNDRALSIMKIVLFIRCLLSLYMYGANNVFAMEKSAFMKWVIFYLTMHRLRHWRSLCFPPCLWSSPGYFLPGIIPCLLFFLDSPSSSRNSLLTI